MLSFVYHSLGFHPAETTEKKLTPEELQQQEAETLNNLKTNIRIGSAWVSTWSLLSREPMYCVLFALASISSEQIASFSYSHRHQFVSVAQWGLSKAKEGLSKLQSTTSTIEAPEQNLSRRKKF